MIRPITRGYYQFIETGAHIAVDGNVHTEKYGFSSASQRLNTLDILHFCDVHDYASRCTFTLQLGSIYDLKFRYT